MTEFDALSELQKTDDYEAVSQVLAKVNAPLADVDSNIILDQTSLSSKANFRKVVESVLKPKFLLKDEYLGVVLDITKESDAVSGRIITRIYVDIPGLNFDVVGHPDAYSDETTDLASIEHKAFYPVSDTLLETETPAYGDIVRVKVPKNWFNSSNVNPQDKKYLGIFRKSSAILPTQDKNISPEAAAKLQLSKEQKRDSLFGNKPTQPIREQDKLIIPFKQTSDTLVSSLPAPRIRPTTGKPQQHYALDITMPVGVDIFAATDHIILETGEDIGGFGTYIKARNDRYLYYYGHLSEKIAKPKARVRAGELIGRSGNTGGSTGPHLHFEIRDFSGKKLNPLFFMQGTLKIKDSIVQEFGLQSNSLVMPFPLEPNQNALDAVSIDTSSESQSVPAATTVNQSRQNMSTNNSTPVNRPRMLLVELDVDQSTGIRINKNVGAKKVKVREDIKPDLLKIKEELNRYNIPMSCDVIDIKLNSTTISLLAKVGLEIRLNVNSALTPNNDLDIDDYFVGPDYSQPLGNGYKLIVYGNVKKDSRLYGIKNIQEKQIIDVYDGRVLMNNGAPKIKKILKNVINITKLFEDAGFIPVLPKQEFFLFSDISKSNWNIFQKPSKIVKGYSYKELLSTVYYDNGEPVWKQPNLIWDGNKFV